MKNPWKTVKRHVIYTNKYGFILRDDDVINPKGGEGKYMVVEHRGCVCILALTKDNKVILVHQWRYPIEESIWEIPAGAVEIEDKRKPYLKTAKRELLEEVGATSNKWIFLGSQWQADGFLDMKSYLFLALNARIVQKPHQEDTELAEVKLMNFETLYKLVVEDEIQDSQTKLAVMLAKKHLDKRA